MKAVKKTADTFHSERIKEMNFSWRVIFIRLLAIFLFTGFFPPSLHSSVRSSLVVRRHELLHVSSIIDFSYTWQKTKIVTTAYPTRASPSTCWRRFRFPRILIRTKNSLNKHPPAGLTGTIDPVRSWTTQSTAAAINHTG